MLQPVEIEVNNGRRVEREQLAQRKATHHGITERLPQLGAGSCSERERGLSPGDSIVEAALLRFRPIMMTTLAALFGALPLALESGVGSELRNPLGITIVGGLLLSQLLTLYTTPVIYLYMDGLKTLGPRIRRLFSRGTPAPTPSEVGAE